VELSEIVKKIQFTKSKVKGLSYIEEQIKTLQHKAKRINVLKKGLYEDYKSGLLNIDEYSELKNEYQNQYNIVQREIENKKEEKETYRQKANEEVELLNRLKAFCSVEETTKELVNEFVDKIIVHQNKTIDIVFSFREEIKKIEYIIAT